MAQLAGSDWVMQQSDGVVMLFHRQRPDLELLRFNPSDADETAKVQHKIHLLQELSLEEKCFAHFWSGYFYAHATGRVGG